MSLPNVQADPLGRPKHWIVEGKLVAGAREPQDAVEVFLTAASKAEAPATRTEIRQEAARRIRAVLNARDDAHAAIIQINALRRVARLHQAQLRGDSLSPDDATYLERASETDTRIEALRDASNRLEADPVGDITDDAHWPE